MKQVTVKKKCNQGDVGTGMCPGELQFTGTVFTSYPAQYKHVCDVCQYWTSFATTYPLTFTEFEPHEKEVRYD